MTNHQVSLIRISDLNFLCSMVSVRRVKVGNINMSQDLQKKNYPLKRKKETTRKMKQKTKKKQKERRIKSILASKLLKFSLILSLHVRTYLYSLKRWRLKNGQRTRLGERDLKIELKIFYLKWNISKTLQPLFQMNSRSFILNETFKESF